MDAVARYQDSRRRFFAEAGIDPTSKYVETNGPVKRVHYLELGQGPPLVVVHGGLGHASEWAPILGPLAEDYHLYVVDRPGHGLTDPIDYRGTDYRANAASFLLSVLDALGLDKAAFMGHSMGGYFSICLALAHPERVERLIMVGAPAGMNLWIPPMLRMLGVPGLNRFLMRTLAKPSPSGHKDVHRQIIVNDVSRLPESFFEHGAHGHQLPGARLAMSTLLESVLTIRGWRKELYLIGLLDQLSMPVHFIWGRQDAFEGPETGQTKAAAIPDHTFAVVEDAGHAVWLDQPERTVELIRKAMEA